MRASDALRRLKEIADPEHARVVQSFFKTGPGEYGEGDRFLGLRVPEIRAVVREYRELAMAEVETLLASPFHEARVLALLIMVHRYKSDPSVYHVYMRNLRHVNNWDLVDTSAPHIVGAHLESRSRAPLRKLARSKSLWERRIAMIATQRFIRNGEFEDALQIATLLIDDEHDLIHKAVGWMLREVGDRDVDILRRFLQKHAATMPRTALRYAIEHFSPAERKRWMGFAPLRAKRG